MTPPRIVPVDPGDRPAWLAQRRQGIGSSDVAPMLGVSHFATPYSLWVDKVEPDLPEEDSDAMRWGRRLEAVIADEFAERHPELVVWKPDVMYAHHEHAHMQANPDRLIFDPIDVNAFTPSAERLPDAILEIKSSNWTEDWEDGPPDHVLLQVQHQLAVMDLERAWIALLMFGRDYREWQIERDDATIALLIDAEREFWQRVIDLDPPPVDGDDLTAKALGAFFDAPDDSAVDGGDRAAELLRERARYKGELAMCEERLTRVENELKALIGNHTRLLVDGEPAASWSVVNQERLDAKALEAAHPEIAAKFRKPSSYRRLSVKKGWA